MRPIVMTVIPTQQRELKVVTTSEGEECVTEQQQRQQEQPLVEEEEGVVVVNNDDELTTSRSMDSSSNDHNWAGGVERGDFASAIGRRNINGTFFTTTSTTTSLVGMAGMISTPSMKLHLIIEEEDEDDDDDDDDDDDCGMLEEIEEFGLTSPSTDKSATGSLSQSGTADETEDEEDEDEEEEEDEHFEDLKPACSSNTSDLSSSTSTSSSSSVDTSMEYLSRQEDEGDDEEEIVFHAGESELDGQEMSRKEDCWNNNDSSKSNRGGGRRRTTTLNIPIFAVIGCSLFSIARSLSIFSVFHKNRYYTPLDTIKDDPSDKEDADEEQRKAPPKNARVVTGEKTKSINKKTAIGSTKTEDETAKSNQQIDTSKNKKTQNDHGNQLFHGFSSSRKMRQQEQQRSPSSNDIGTVTTNTSKTVRSWISSGSSSMSWNTSSTTNKKWSVIFRFAYRLFQATSSSSSPSSASKQNYQTIGMESNRNSMKMKKNKKAQHKKHQAGSFADATRPIEQH